MYAIIYINIHFVFIYLCMKTFVGCCLPMLSRFGILAWIRSGDGMQKALMILRFYHFSVFVVFFANVCIEH